MFNLLMDFIIKAFRYMASLLTHFKSAQGRTTVIGYHFGFETGQTVSVAFNLGCEIIKLMS